MSQFNSKRLAATALIAAVTVVAVTVSILDKHSNSTFQLSSAPASRYIDVQASGTAKVTPDAIDLPISISATAASNTAANATAASAAAKVRGVLNHFAIASADITTTSLVTNPVYAYGANNAQTLTGYQVSQSLDVIVRDTKNAGSLIDSVIKAGGNNVTINGATPTILDSKAGTALAEKDAIANAKAKAAAYASTLGLKVGSVISITETPGSTSPMPLMAMKAAVGTPTQINLGTQDLSVNVDVRWAIG